MIGSVEAVSGLVLLAFIVLGACMLGFLLFISPLMFWLNLRRLRMELHADLEMLRASLERLAGAPSQAAAPPVPAAAPAPAGAPAAAAPAPDQIGFSCPECGKFFEGPSKLAGTDYTCPECRVSFHIH